MKVNFCLNVVAKVIFVFCRGQQSALNMGE